MSNTIYGIREYTCSEKTKREQKIEVDETLTDEQKQKQIEEILKKRNEKNEKRNNTQKRLYITLENIDEMFSNNDDKYPISYNFLFNLIQGKVTKYFKTTFYERKKELSYSSIARLYSILKRKLLKLKEQENETQKKPVLFFYLSQFFRYVDLVVFSTVYYGTIDLKFEVQELEDVPLIQEMTEKEDDNDEIENIIMKTEKRNIIKKCIDSNNNLTAKEKALIHKIYRTSTFMGGNLTNKDKEELKLLQEKLQLQPGLLQDLEDICND